jgi:hypothetical protein
MRGSRTTTAATRLRSSAERGTQRDAGRTRRSSGPVWRDESRSRRRWRPRRVRGRLHKRPTTTPVMRSPRSAVRDIRLARARMRPSSAHASPEECHSDQAPSLCRYGWMIFQAFGISRIEPSGEMVRARCGACLANEAASIPKIIWRRAAGTWNFVRPRELPWGAETQCYPAFAEPNLRYTSTAGLGPG